jgi:vancomycin permeability regulator SanA
VASILACYSKEQVQTQLPPQYQNNKILTELSTYKFENIKTILLSAENKMKIYFTY